MKVLILSHHMPYPPQGGNETRTWNFVRALVPAHEVSLLCSAGKEDADALREARKYLANIWLVGKDKTDSRDSTQRRWKKAKHFLLGVPELVSKSFSEAFENKFLEVIQNYNFDIIVARYIVLGQYLIRNALILNGRVKTVVDVDDLVFKKMERLRYVKLAVTAPQRIFWWMDNYYLRLYHNKLRLLDGCIVCSKEDKAYLQRSIALEHVFVVPNALNVSAYTDVSVFSQSVLNNKIILFCGTLSYAPNVDAIHWFVKRIFPLIKEREPAVKLHIVGLRPRDEIFALADGESIVVFSNVPSMLPFYAETSLVVIPLRAGGGTRIKILEALACNRPVVSTTIGAEGLGLTHNQQCVMEDTPEGFACSCVEVLQDYSKARCLTEAGSQFVKQQYDAHIVFKTVTDVFETLVRQGL